LYKQDLDSNWPLNQNRTIEREREGTCVSGFCVLIKKKKTDSTKYREPQEFYAVSQGRLSKLYILVILVPILFMKLKNPLTSNGGLFEPINTII